VWLTTIASLVPPVCVAEPVMDVLAREVTSASAPIINLLRKSGVPLDPLHKYHPVGIEAMVPDHIPINPEGTEFVSTKAVVAICVVFVPAEAVGAVGVPKRSGLDVFALDAIAEAIAVNSISNSVPFTILFELPVGSVSLVVKFVDFE
jgi:hypothetical protein